HEIAWLAEQPLGDEDSACVGRVTIAAACWLLARWPGAGDPWVRAAGARARGTLERAAAPRLADACAKLEGAPDPTSLPGVPADDGKDETCSRLLRVDVYRAKQP